MNATIDQHDYLFDRTNERERLGLQARVWEPAAEGMIKEIAVAPGSHCVDLGCGAIGVLRPLSRAVGATGSVIGIDNDPTLLAISREFAETEELRNVKLVQGDALANGLPRGEFDFVHARFVFAPLGRDKTLLREMIDLAKPGGIIAAQEPDASSWNCYPQRAGWDALKPAILRAFRSNGGDFDAGTRLFGLMRQARLRDIQVRTHVIALPPGHPYRRLPGQLAASLRKQIVGRGLLSTRELEAAMIDCDCAAADQNTIFNTFTLTQAWGRKAP